MVKTGGRPPRFKNGGQLVDLFREFCGWIRQNDFQSIPSQTRFCEWLAEEYMPTSRRTIYNALNRYFPTIKKEFQRIQADTLTEGAMTGKYNPTMTIFALKNWCDWKDRQETEFSGRDGGPIRIASEQDAREALEALGYAKRE